MLGSGRSYFTEILQELLNIEKTKQMICHELLQVSDKDVQLKLVYSFLASDLDKHEMLEQAALLACKETEDYLLKQLELFYKHCEGKDLLLKIRAEISRVEMYLDTVDKAIENSAAISFMERRLIQEISRYVITQARYYNAFKPAWH